MSAKDKSKFVRVRREGGTNVISVGKLIPSGWTMVELITQPHKDENSRLLLVRKVA